MSSKESADSGKGQYQILASEDGMEGVGSFPSSGNPSSGGRTSGNPKEQ